MTPRVTGLLSFAAIPVFFALKVGSALVLLTASTAWLPVAGFAEFTQLLILAALLNLIAIGGAQNGIVRMTASASAAEEIGRTRGAALAIWLAVMLVGGLLGVLLRTQLSTVLVGDAHAATAAMAVVLLTLAGGPGQIFTSMLTGRGRSTAALSAQGCGLVAGLLGALYMLRLGDAGGAAIAFAAGPLVTMAVAWLRLRGERLSGASFARLGQEVRTLLAFSASMIAMTAFASVILFGLRYVYQEAFGLQTLGLWLAASRISDTTTQFLGLILLQLFVPRYVTLEEPHAAVRLVLLTWLAGLAVMASFLAVFATAPQFLVRLFLSPDYLPAIGGILLYMAGDTLRVWAALAMNVQLARGRPWRYALIEMGTLTLMAGLTLAGIAMREPRAPMLAYVAAYGFTALLVTVWFARGRIARARAMPRPALGPGEAVL